MHVHQHQEIEVTSNGGYIEENVEIEVIHIDGKKIRANQWKYCDFDDDNELIYWLEGASLEPNTNLDFFAFSDHGKFNAIYLTFS